MNQLYSSKPKASNDEPDDAMYVVDVAKELGLSKQGFNTWLHRYTAQHGQDYWMKRIGNRVKVLLHEMQERRKHDGLSYGNPPPWFAKSAPKEMGKNVTPLPAFKPIESSADPDWSTFLEHLSYYRNRPGTNGVFEALIASATRFQPRRSA